MAGSPLRKVEGLTIVEVRNGPQDVTAGIQRLGFANGPGGVPSGEQDYLRVDKSPGGYGVVQRLSQGEWVRGNRSVDFGWHARVCGWELSTRSRRSLLGGSRGMCGWSYVWIDPVRGKITEVGNRLDRKLSPPPL